MFCASDLIVARCCLGFGLRLSGASALLLSPHGRHAPIVAGKRGLRHRHVVADLAKSAAKAREKPHYTTSRAGTGRTMRMAMAAAVAAVGRPSSGRLDPPPVRD